MNLAKSSNSEKSLSLFGGLGSTVSALTTERKQNDCLPFACKTCLSGSTWFA